MFLFRSGIGRLCFKPGYGFFPRANTKGDTSTVYFFLTQSRFDVASPRAGFSPTRHRSGSMTVCLKYSSLKVLGSKVDASKGVDSGVAADLEHNFGIDIFTHQNVVVALNG